jgi:twinkle protein
MGEFIVVTGIPQHGKSSWTLQLLAQMAKNHGLRSAIFSPEMKIVPVIRDRLCSIRDRHPSPHSPETWAWVEDMFTFIGRDPRGGGLDDEDFTLENIIEKAEDAVLRDGIRFLLVDPWNEVEHAREKNETLTEYVARGIRLLKRFAMTYNVTVIVVAHPTKMGKNKDGMLETPGLYDISDSAAWYNKADHGVVIWRDFEANCTEVHIVKSRFDEAGEPGVVKMHFDRQTHRFEPLAFTDTR